MINVLRIKVVLWGVIIAKTPTKQDISPIIFVRLIFSLKKILEIKIINIGEDVYIIPILVTVVV